MSSLLYFCLVLVFWPAIAAGEEELAAAWKLLHTGQYEACLESATQAIHDEHQRDEQWWLLRIRSLEALGRYGEAARTVESALEGDDYYPLRFSLPLRIEAFRLNRLVGSPDRASQRAEEIGSLARQTPYRYAQAANLVALGRWALELGEDPKQVLEVFFERSIAQRPEYREGYLAAGELALAKGDFAEAARIFQRGLDRLPQDPDLHFGLARAFAPNDWTKAATFLVSTLNINPRHADAMLLLADRAIDAERYQEARSQLDAIEQTNPLRPEMWAYRAVIAHLEGDRSKEGDYYAAAKRHWPNDPAIDYLVGKKLSQHYRFAEGAAFQRRALASDAGYLPSKLQLAQDLLRLGEVAEGWKLVLEAQQADSYNVTAFNLATLKDTLDTFTVLEDRDFVLRMEPGEASLYGDRALALLRRAKETLCSKYGLHLEEPVTVEIFPRQEDFAVRTFGMPGGAGYLGVCFGRVITANSPSSRRESPANWEAVLWHEFCHVVTLELTHNRMPRWLSEGISVYEERQADARWGESMNRRYREMILRGELTPIGRLSEAFLSPPSPLHLQFAYYQSSLVVEFVVERFGLHALRRVLLALGAGMSINDALEAHVGSLAVLQSEFEQFAIAKARKYGSQIDWQQPEETRGPVDWATWLHEHPKNYWGYVNRGRELLREGKWPQARDLLKELITAFPDCVEGESPYAMLAMAHRELGEADEEIQVLGAWCARDADALEAAQRLAELGISREDWELARRSAEQMLSIDPLLPAPHEYLARAADHLGDRWQAVDSYERLLRFESGDASHVHFRMACLMAELAGIAGDAELRRHAREHVLLALEEAPRYREAQRLLLQLAGAGEEMEGEAARQEPAAVDDNPPKPSEGETSGEEPEPEPREIEDQGRAAKASRSEARK